MPKIASKAKARKTKTSITLSTAVLAGINRAIGRGGSRSAFIEKVLQDHLRDEARRGIQTRDKRLIDAAHEKLNEEAEDVLRYQAPYL
jgi:metal-responsive CopG/Arc/MetJ family transcriptional regulator